MRIILSIAFGLITAAGFSQNLINNPSVEDGTIPTNYGQVSYATDWYNGCGTQYHNVSGGSVPGSPDLFDSRSTSTCYDFSNKWGNLTALNTGYGANRYLGFSGGNFASNGSYYFGETVKGTINTSLAANCPYTISFSAASIREVYDCAGAIDNTLTTPNTTYNKIEVVLRKNNDCSIGKSVMISGSLNSTSWTQYSGQFTLTAAEASVGYNRIEFRFMALPNSSVTPGTRLAFLDEVSLTRGCPLPNANYNFVTIGQTYTTLATPFGPEELTQVCASPSPAITPVLINGGASSNETGYGIEITPITVNANTYSISGPSIYNAWISTTGQVPTTDININNLPGMTTHMQVGQTYLVSLFVGDFPQHRKTRLFRINPLPTINAGVDATYCSADGVNITTSNWPVQVHKTGGILVGTYSSNPIMLPVATSNTYTFTTTNAFGCGAQDNAVLTMKLCSRASFFYKNPIGTTIINGNIFSEICSPYKIDGSASTNENAYHFRIQQYDPYLNQTVGPVLYENWYGSGSVGNDIPLATVLSTVGSSFVYNNYYLVGLSVGPDWHTDFKFFKAIDCTKSGAAVLEEVTTEQQNIEVFPNPNDGVFAVSFDNQTVQYLEVTDLTGKSVFATDVPNDATAVNIDLHDLTKGVYMVNIHHTNGEITMKKIIKN